jgi:hypothetical protein
MTPLPSGGERRGRRGRLSALLLLLILLLAASLRFYHLGAVPPGLTHDEAGHGHDALAILHGARPIYQTVGYGREPLYDYLLAGWMGVAGTTIPMLRLSGVLLGLGTLLVTFAWVRLAFDEITALAAVALQAASFWSLATSRQVLRSSLLPLLFTAAVYFYWRAIYGPAGVRGDEKRGGLRWEVAGVGLALGASLYTYIPARVLWLAFPLFLAYLALFHRPIGWRVVLSTLIGVGAGLLLAVPLFAYLQAHPHLERRLGMLSGPLEALAGGNPAPLLERMAGYGASFFLPGRGDDFLAYALPGRPVFDLLTGALFLAGLVWCVARIRRPACGFALVWLAAGISPSLLTGATASTTRSIAAMPVVFLFPALAFAAARRRAAARWGGAATWGVELAFAALVLVTGWSAARDYFVSWGRSAEVRAAYQHTLVEEARVLDARPEVALAALSSLYPHAPHDPYVFELGLQRDDLATRWFDGRRALVLPDRPSACLLAPSGAPLAPYFADLPGLHEREVVHLRPDDLDPFFIVYDWEPRAGRAALQARLAASPAERALPVNFGDAFELLGYELRVVGREVEVTTLWRVLDPIPLRPSDLSIVEQDVTLFVHVLDEAGHVVAQEDRLDAPAWDWQAGDLVAQIHRLSLPSERPPGELSLHVGAYRRLDGRRWPVLADGEVVADHVLLQRLEIVDE